MTTGLASHPSFNAASADLAQLELLFAAGRFAECRRLAGNILRYDGQSAFAWKVLVACIAALEGAEAAIAVYRKAPSALERDWQFQNNYGNALKSAGRHAEAAERYRRAIDLNGAPIEPVYNLGVTLLESGDLAEAEPCLRQVLTMQPQHGLSHLNLANILNAQDRRPEAELHYKCAMLAMPRDPRLLNNYGQLLGKMHRFPEAEWVYRRAIELDEHFAHPCVNMAELMSGHGLLAEAEMLLRHALRLDPTLAKAHSNLLFVMALRDNVTPAALFTEHRRFAAQFEAPLKPSWPQHSNTRDPHRTLRVGFISGDLRDHPVMRYLPQALDGLRSSGDFTLVAYNNGIRRDSVTALYRKLFHEWRDVAMIADSALAQLVSEDGIDILIDLSGHSGDNRMLVFARKPAPVQMSWLGYVGTTGLDAMDYFVGDEHLVPHEMEWQFTEKILRLPATATFAAHQPPVAPNALPALTNGFITFCCLARINKLNAPLITLWARAMHAVPTSRMLLLTLPDGNPPAMVEGWFAAQGVAKERLTFVHARSVEEILRLHHYADLGLDTAPFNGSTTIQHALTMGVPTLTLHGEVPGGRLGGSIAAGTGIPQFIADTTDDFVEKAVFWSQHTQQLAELRRNLPAKFAAGSLCRHEEMTAHFAGKLRQAWIRWCEGLPPCHL